MSLFPPSVYRVPRRERRRRARSRVFKAIRLPIDPIEYHFDILDYRWYGTNTGWGEAVAGRECVLVDSSKFVSPTYYFEVVMKIDNASANAYAHLLDLGVSDVVSGGVEVPGSVLQTNRTSFVRLRSGALSLTSGNRFRIQYRTDNASYSARINGARIIVVDDISGGWTNGEELVDIFTSIAYTPSVADTWATVPRPAIYMYETSPRNGTVKTYFEVCLSCNTAGKTVRARLIEHSNADLSDTGTAVTNSQINITPANADVPVRGRSAQITLADGKYYAVQITCATAGKAVGLRGAKIVIQQTDTITKTQLHRRCGIATDKTGDTSWFPSESQRYLQKSNLPVSQTYLYQCTIKTDSASVLAYGDLYNIDDSAEVPGSVLQTYSTVYIWLRSSSIQLADLKHYDSRVRIENGVQMVSLAAGYLVINVSSAPLAPVPATLTLLGVG